MWKIHSISRSQLFTFTSRLSPNYISMITKRCVYIIFLYGYKNNLIFSFCKAGDMTFLLTVAGDGKYIKSIRLLEEV